MNRSTLTMLALLASAPAAHAADGLTDPPLGNDVRSVAGFEFDLTELGPPPAPQLPVDRLRPENFGLGEIVNRLLQVQEPFELVEVIADREFYESPTWYLERDPAAGRILALRKPVEVIPQPQSDGLMRVKSLQRLDIFGIRGGEISRVLQRRLMRNDEAEGQIEPPDVFRYKTFAMRGINGVDIEGNRAVVTHHLDGSFNRAWLEWPPLAGTGHRLRTDADENLILLKATIALLAAGEREGRARLRWKYVPTLLPNGEAVLELEVVARLDPAPDGDDGDGDKPTEEPRDIAVSVDAF